MMTTRIDYFGGDVSDGHYNSVPSAEACQQDCQVDHHVDDHIDVGKAHDNDDADADESGDVTGNNTIFHW